MVYFDQILRTYYLFILTLCKTVTTHHFGRSRYFSENAHNFERHVIHVF